MKIILGIDPGLASTGFGVIRQDGNRFRHVAHGVITTSSQEPMGDRLVRLHRGIDEIVRTYAPHEAAVESVYFSKNSRSAIPVAQARGVILFTLAARGVTFAEYTPLELKQAVVGKGKAEKRQIQEVLRMILNLPEIPSPDHAADALAAAFCHAGCADFRRRIAAVGREHV